MKSEYPEADFDKLERRLRERHAYGSSDSLRARVLGAVAAELDAPSASWREGGMAWYVAIAACLLLGLGLAQAASITPLISQRVAEPRDASVSAAVLRRLSPDLSEADAQEFSRLVSMPRAALALPVAQTHLSSPNSESAVLPHGETK